MNREESLCGQELIDRAQQGNRQAMDTVIEMHQPLLWSLAKRLCCTRVSLEELVQAGNIGLLCALGRYQSRKQTKLTTYAVPWILGEMRRAIKQAEDFACSLDEGMGEDSQTLHDTLVGCEGVDADQVDLRAALSKLAPEAQILLSLRYFRDKTQKEAAMLMGKSQAQISRIESRALMALQGMLREA